MVEMLDPLDYAYDVVQGVSIGSVNAAMMAINERGDERRTIKWMENMWQDCSGSDSWDNWPHLGILEGFWRPSLLDTSPFAERLHAQFRNETLKRPLIVSAVDLNTGKVVIFDEEVLKTGYDIAEAVLSSASIPGVFPPNKFMNGSFGDGGVFANLELTNGILKCKELGYDEKDIIVDIIMCT